jgi:hypothetical protein
LERETEYNDSLMRAIRGPHGDPLRGRWEAMSSSSTMLILLGVGAVLAIFLLLVSPAEQTATEAVPAQLATSMTIGAEPVSRATGAPVVNAGPDRTVGERETVELSGEGYGATGAAVAYLWTAEGGLGFFENPRSPTTSYTAPSACDCEETVLLTLTVTNASGASASDSMVLSVRDPLSCPTETYEAGGAFVTVIDPCRTVGAETTCPAQPAEACASPCITNVPAYEGCPEAPVPCPCSTDGCEGGWMSNWPFGPQSEHPRDRPKPRIDRHYFSSINEGSAMPIKGNISNPVCVSVCFTWSASKGWLEGANTLQPIYHAPESDRRDGETVTITLAAYDSSGGRSYDQIRVRIVNTDPM